jgi:hypothetical protein
MPDAACAASRFSFAARRRLLITSACLPPPLFCHYFRRRYFHAAARRHDADSFHFSFFGCRRCHIDADFAIICSTPIFAFRQPFRQRCFRGAAITPPSRCAAFTPPLRHAAAAALRHYFH